MYPVGRKLSCEEWHVIIRQWKSYRWTQVPSSGIIALHSCQDLLYQSRPWWSWMLISGQPFPLGSRFLKVAWPWQRDQTPRVLQRGRGSADQWAFPVSAALFCWGSKKKKLLKAQDWAVCPLWRAGLVENNSLFQISSKANNARSSPWSEAAELSRLPRLRVMCEWSKKPWLQPAVIASLLRSPSVYKKPAVQETEPKANCRSCGAPHRRWSQSKARWRMSGVIRGGSFIHYLW